jgi:hypothetical protein
MTFDVSIEHTPADDRLTDHLETVVRNLLRGRVTPVLGAGASLYGRGHVGPGAPAPPAADVGGADADAVVPAARRAGVDDPDVEGVRADRWTGAPSAPELADSLKREFKVKETTEDLLQIAQWVYALRGGSGGLYEALHEIFARDFPPTGLHEFLAAVPHRLRDAGRERPLLIVTTNYDDLIEKSLDAHDEPYDVVVYMAEGEHEGRFCHVGSEGQLTPIEQPETYLDVDPEKRTVVLKMHGFVCRRDPSADSYVITEDHYIEYLTRTDLTKLLPRPVMARLLNCHLLFLGYSLRDWNFRAILYQIHQHRLHDNDWWAVQLNPDRLERRSWEKRNVEILDLPLEQYIPILESAFAAELGQQPTAIV